MYYELKCVTIELLILGIVIFVNKFHILNIKKYPMTANFDVSSSTKFSCALFGGELKSTVTQFLPFKDCMYSAICLFSPDVLKDKSSINFGEISIILCKLTMLASVLE